MLASFAWVTVRGLAARTRLESAQAQGQQLRTQVSGGDIAAARRTVERIQDDASSARRMTDDPVWRVLRLVPLLGDTPRAVSGVATATDVVARSALPQLVDAAEVLAPDKLQPAPGRLDLTRFQQGQPYLDQAVGALELARRSVPQRGGWELPPVRRGVQDAQRSLRQLTRVTRNTARATRLLPPMLGAEGPRNYLIALQNPAESRGTGGLIGAYGVLQAREGTVRLLTLGPNTDLRGARRLPVDLGADYQSLYGDDPAIWLNSNLSPHFPYAAQIWLALWRQQFGAQLDGVIATDALALGYLVAAVPGLEPVDGVRLTGANTADLLLRGIYERFPDPDQNDLRDSLLTRLGIVAFRGLLRAQEPRRLLEGVTRAVDEGRLRVFSSHTSEQAVLTQTSVGGVLTDDDRPFVSVVVNNGARNKLDLYLDRGVRYKLGPCVRGRRNTRIEITLTNASPTGLPAYVVGDFRDNLAATGPPPGTNRLLVFVFATPGAAVTGASLDGAPLRLRFGTERRHPVFVFAVDLPRHEARRAVLELVEPAHHTKPYVAEQPLARRQRSVITRALCQK